MIDSSTNLKKLRVTGAHGRNWKGDWSGREMLRNLPVAVMMCRQRVAATKIDSPLMAVSGRHLRLEHGKACDTDEVGDQHILNFSRLSHTTGDVAMTHTGGEKSSSARDRVRDLRGMARVACFTMNANSCHPTTQPRLTSLTSPTRSTEKSFTST